MINEIKTINNRLRDKSISDSEINELIARRKYLIEQTNQTGQYVCGFNAPLSASLGGTGVIDGILPIISGGIGMSSIATSGVLIGAGTNKPSIQIISGGVVGTKNLQEISNKIINGNCNSITNIGGGGSITGIIPVIQGGTGLSAIPLQGILVGNNSSTPSVQVLNGGIVDSSSIQSVANKIIDGNCNSITSTNIYGGTNIITMPTIIPTPSQVLAVNTISSNMITTTWSSSLSSTTDYLSVLNNLLLSYNPTNYWEPFTSTPGTLWPNSAGGAGSYPINLTGSTNGIADNGSIYIQGSLNTTINGTISSSGQFTLISFLTFLPINTTGLSITDISNNNQFGISIQTNGLFGIYSINNGSFITNLNSYPARLNNINYVIISHNPSGSPQTNVIINGLTCTLTNSLLFGVINTLKLNNLSRYISTAIFNTALSTTQINNLLPYLNAYCTNSKPYSLLQNPSSTSSYATTPNVTNITLTNGKFIPTIISTGTATAFNIGVQDSIILCTNTAPLAVTLPWYSINSPGTVFTIKDAVGTANVNNITINTTDGTLIDGSTTYVINSAYGCVSLCASTTSKWLVIG